MPFADAQLKIERANKHVADIERRIAGLKNAYIATIEINPKAGNKVIKHDLADRTVRTDVALIAGDAIHNLKCALDYAWFAAVEPILPPALTKRTKFPVYPTVDKLETALREIEVDLAGPDLFKLMVTEIKPYKGGNFAIWPIHKLDIGDKHRLLIPIIHFATIKGIELEKDGESMTLETNPTVQVPPYYIPIQEGWHIANKGEVSVSVMLNDRVAGGPMRMVETLKLFSRFVLQVVDVLERV